MKKLLTMSLALAMVLSLASCGGTATDNSSDNEPATSASVEDKSEAASEEATEEETEPTTEDAYAGMTKLDLGEGYCGFNASFYVPQDSFEISYENFDGHAMHYYKSSDPSIDLKATLSFVSKTNKESSMSKEENVYKDNENGLEGVFSYSEDTKHANYYFYKEGAPGDQFVQMEISLGLSTSNLDDAQRQELFDAIGKSMNIEGEYEEKKGANGGLLSEDGTFEIPEEAEIKGQKTTFEMVSINGHMRIQGKTPEIDGVEYKITEYGDSSQSSYDELINDKSGREVTIGEYKAAALLYIREGRLNSNYYIKLSDDKIIAFDIDGMKTDFDGYTAKLANEYDATEAIYNEIAADYLKAATIYLE